MIYIIILAFVIALFIVIVEHKLQKPKHFQQINHLNKIIEKNNRILDKFDEYTIEKLGQKMKEKEENNNERNN